MGWLRGAQPARSSIAATTATARRSRRRAGSGPAPVSGRLVQCRAIERGFGGRSQRGHFRQCRWCVAGTRQTRGPSCCRQAPTSTRGRRSGRIRSTARVRGRATVKWGSVSDPAVPPTHASASGALLSGAFCLECSDEKHAHRQEGDSVAAPRRVISRRSGDAVTRKRTAERTALLSSGGAMR